MVHPALYINLPGPNVTSLYGEAMPAQIVTARPATLPAFSIFVGGRQLFGWLYQAGKLTEGK